MKKNDFGVWEIVVPAKNGQTAIPHDSKVKVNESILLPMNFLYKLLTQ